MFQVVQYKTNSLFCAVDKHRGYEHNSRVPEWPHLPSALRSLKRWKGVMFPARHAACFSILVLIVCSVPNLFSQGAKIGPDAAQTQNRQAVERSQTEQDRPLDRDKWFLKGRVTGDKETAAQKLHRAYGQKSRKHEEKALESKARLASVAAAGAAGVQESIVTSGTGASWTPLGPAPIISDPSGNQSYGNVAGRVTAVTVDPNDP